MSRKHLMIMVIGGATGLLLLLLILQQHVLGPAADDRTAITQLQQELNQLEIESRRQSAARRRLASYARRTLGGDPLRVSEALRIRLVEMLNRSNLSNEHLSLKPVAGRRVRGAYQEIGWTVRARGGLSRIVDLLYLAQHQPYLLSVDDISITPVSRSLDSTLRARCTTLVLDESVTGRTEVAAFEDDPNALPLNSDDRRLYAAITRRDLLRPYIQRPPPRPSPSPPAAETAQPEPAPSPAAPGPERFRLVGLPQWGDEVDVLVRDTTSGQVQRYKVGQSLAGGKIVMVDYRRMPYPDQPELFSYSRVIIRIGGDYWALDLGRALDQRYRLQRAQWPPSLRNNDETSAAEGSTADRPGDA